MSSEVKLYEIFSCTLKFPLVKSDTENSNLDYWNERNCWNGWKTKCFIFTHCSNIHNSYTHISKFVDCQSNNKGLANFNSKFQFAIRFNIRFDQISSSGVFIKLPSIGDKTHPSWETFKNEVDMYIEMTLSPKEGNDETHTAIWSKDFNDYGFPYICKKNILETENTLKITVKATKPFDGFNKTNPFINNTATSTIPPETKTQTPVA